MSFTRPISGTVYLNTSREFIMIDANSLLVHLYEYTDAIQKKGDCISYAVSLFTIILALVTADFHDFFGFPAQTWQAVFIVLLLPCSAMLAWKIYNGIRYRGTTPRVFVENVVSQSERQEGQDSVLRQF